MDGVLSFPSRKREGQRDLRAQCVSRSGVGFRNVQPIPLMGITRLPPTPPACGRGNMSGIGRNPSIPVGVILTFVRMTKMGMAAPGGGPPFVRRAFAGARFF